MRQSNYLFIFIKPGRSQCKLESKRYFSFDFTAMAVERTKSQEFMKRALKSELLFFF